MIYKVDGKMVDGEIFGELYDGLHCGHGMSTLTKLTVICLFELHLVWSIPRRANAVLP